MSLIKLFSGMDFSGKSTTIESIDKAMPGIFKRQQKFLTPIHTLQRMIDNDIWIPRDKFIPLLQKMVRDDLRNYRENTPILQDTLWVIKFTSKLIVDGSNDYMKEIKELMRMIKCYPDMDSFYITTSMEEREKRYEKRIRDGGRISRSDSLLFSGNIFEEVEKRYQEIVFMRFPDTQIIDTTCCTTEQIIEDLMQNARFMNNLEDVRIYYET